MSEAKHTPKPWRWEFNSRSRRLELVGGEPRYDLTIMDFVRWDMNGAIMRLRENQKNLNIMRRVCDIPSWISPIKGREHHYQWCSTINHPDAILMAAAPDLLDALKNLLAKVECGTALYCELCDAARAAIAKAEGKS